MNAPVPHPLIIAAAQAAGPCTPGLEAAWHSRVRGLAIDLHLDAVQVAAELARIQGAKDRVRGILVKVGVEESSNRGIITIKALGRGEEQFRTDRLENDSGQHLYQTAQRLVGRLVRVYKELDTTKTAPGQRTNRVRMAVHLVDLGPADGAISETEAKEMVVHAVGGDKDRAASVWRAAGLPDSGSVPQEQLEAALAGLPSPDESDGQ
ncbi:hypothetical protein [Streptomyces goshikiensis]|uniref:hypothetical protein n=1 Tax=Streptomyces goshikiensis TaxID=1942 RepID=UPI00368C1286